MQLKRWEIGMEADLVDAFIVPSQTRTINGKPYALRALVFHIGEDASSGHYVAVTADAEDADSWHFCNDSLVSTFTTAELLLLCPCL